MELENTSAADFVLSKNNKKESSAFELSVFKGIWLFYMCLDFLLSTVLGYSLVRGWKRDEEQAAKAKYCGHLMTIVGKKNKKTPDDANANPNDYILLHKEYVNTVADYFVVQQHNVMIAFIGLSKSKAWFSVTSSHGSFMEKVPLVSSIITPFLINEKLLVVDRATLNWILEKTQDQKGSILNIEEYFGIFCKVNSM